MIVCAASITLSFNMCLFIIVFLSFCCSEILYILSHSLSGSVSFIWFPLSFEILSFLIEFGFVLTWNMQVLFSYFGFEF